MKWKILARHKYPGITISESGNGEEIDGISIRKLIATIRGFRNWKIYEGKICPVIFLRAIGKATEIGNRIDNGDESVFTEDVSIKSETNDKI